MSYRVRFTEAAEADLIRLYEFILARDQSDWAVAERALDAIRNAIRSLELSPFSYRKAISIMRDSTIRFNTTHNAQPAPTRSAK